MKLLFFLFMIFTFTVLDAQILEGNIIYEVKINLHRKVPADQSEMLSRIPEFQVSNMDLFFRKEASLYKEIEDDLSGGRGFRMRFGGVTVFTDLLNEQRVESRDMFGEAYLVEDEVKYFPWKLESKMKSVAGKMCQLAYFEMPEDSLYVEAWFSPEIPLSIGPENFRGLPGAILELDVNFGERIFTATGIRETKVNDRNLKPPSKGKKVTEVEYDAMMKERMEQLKEQGGRGFRRRGG